MIAPDYRLIAELSREPSAVLYRAERHRDRARVLVKATTTGVHGPFAAAAVRREHALITTLEGLECPGSRADESESGTALVLEDPGGVLLATRLAGWPDAARRRARARTQPREHPAGAGTARASSTGTSTDGHAVRVVSRGGSAMASAR